MLISSSVTFNGNKYTIAAGLFVEVGFGSLTEGISPVEQIAYQLIGIGASCIWSFVVTVVILLALKYTIGLRVSEQTEKSGIDDSEHGEPGCRI